MSYRPQVKQNGGMQDLPLDAETVKGRNVTQELDNIKTFYAHGLKFDINNSTFVITATLTDGEGNTLSSEKIDLPLESVVVDGEFNAQNDTIVLTLQNGNTIDIPVGDLIDGLASQTEIDDLSETVETNSTNITNLDSNVQKIINGTTPVGTAEVANSVAATQLHNDADLNDCVPSEISKLQVWVCNNNAMSNTILNAPMQGSMNSTFYLTALKTWDGEEASQYRVIQTLYRVAPNGVQMFSRAVDRGGSATNKWGAWNEYAVAEANTKANTKVYRHEISIKGTFSIAPALWLRSTISVPVATNFGVSIDITVRNNSSAAINSVEKLFSNGHTHTGRIITNSVKLGTSSTPRMFEGAVSVTENDTVSITIKVNGVIGCANIVAEEILFMFLNGTISSTTITDNVTELSY